MIIDARNLSRFYRRGREQIHALRAVSFTVAPGEFICLLGRAGAGKTTLLNQLGLIDTPTGGTLTIESRTVSDQGRPRLPADELNHLRRSMAGFVFQDFYLLPTLTALENVALPSLWTGRANPARARELLAMVGLAHRLQHRPGELSGGEMQRVAVARALINRPPLLLADEPTGNLDTRTRDQILDMLTDLNRRTNLTIILATHDRAIADRTPRVLHLEEGCLV